MGTENDNNKNNNDNNESILKDDTQLLHFILYHYYTNQYIHNDKLKKTLTDIKMKDCMSNIQYKKHVKEIDAILEHIQVLMSCTLTLLMTNPFGLERKLDFYNEIDINNIVEKAKSDSEKDWHRFVNEEYARLNGLEYDDEFNCFSSKK